MASKFWGGEESSDDEDEVEETESDSDSSSSSDSDDDAKKGPSKCVRSRAAGAGKGAHGAGPCRLTVLSPASASRLAGAHPPVPQVPPRLGQ
jgi:hypothetical protein